MGYVWEFYISHRCKEEPSNGVCLLEISNIRSKSLSGYPCFSAPNRVFLPLFQISIIFEKLTLYFEKLIFNKTFDF